MEREVLSRSIRTCLFVPRLSDRPLDMGLPRPAWVSQPLLHWCWKISIINAQMGTCFYINLKMGTNKSNRSPCDSGMSITLCLQRISWNLRSWMRRLDAAQQHCRPYLKRRPFIKRRSLNNLIVMLFKINLLKLFYFLVISINIMTEQRISGSTCG